MDINKIAEIIAGTRRLSLKYHQSIFYTDMLIDTLANYFEDESGDDQGKYKKYPWFDRPEFIRIATDDNV